MDSPSKDEVLNQLSEFIELHQSNPDEDTGFVKLLELLNNDDFLKRFYMYLIFRIKREHQEIIRLIESNLINNKTTSIVSVLYEVNQTVMKFLSV